MTTSAASGAEDHEMVFLTVSRQRVSGSEGEGGTVTGGEDETEGEEGVREGKQRGGRGGKLLQTM